MICDILPRGGQFRLIVKLGNLGLSPTNIESNKWKVGSQGYKLIATVYINFKFE